MQQIIFFFIRNKNFLLFLLLFIVSLALTVNSHNYHKNKYITSANFFSGGIYNAKTSITDYFNLKQQNNRLAEENRRLRALLSVSEDSIQAVVLDSALIPGTFTYYPAKVINNSYSKTKNYLTLKRNPDDSIEADMGVISSKGIVGIVNRVSKKYASVQSILNTNSQINAKLKKSNHFGSLTWDTKNPNEAQLIDIPRQAPVTIGDTIVTDGKSTIFPRGILVGAVKDFNLSNNQDYYDMTISLFNDMTDLHHVYIIENNEKEAIQAIENPIENAEQ